MDDMLLEEGGDDAGAEAKTNTMATTEAGRSVAGDGRLGKPRSGNDANQDEADQDGDKQEMNE